MENELMLHLRLIKNLVWSNKAKLEEYSLDSRTSTTLNSAIDVYAIQLRSISLIIITIVCQYSTSTTSRAATTCALFQTSPLETHFDTHSHFSFDPHHVQCSIERF